MKKALLLSVFVSAFALGAAAQQPADKIYLPRILLSPNSLEIKVDTNVSALTGKPGNNLALRNKALSQSLIPYYTPSIKTNFDNTVYSTMPVVGHAKTDNMPIVKLGKSDTRYTMLIKRVDIVDPTKAKPSTGTENGY